jgi:hypothetical protein
MEKIGEDFDTAKTQLKSKMQSMLPQKIFKSPERSKGVEGWAEVNPADVIEYILSDEMGNISSSELQEAKDAIKNPWDKRKALRTNLEEMVDKNNLIGETFPHMKLNDQLMFQIAFRIAENPIYDLKDTINDFITQPNQEFLTQEYAEFLTLKKASKPSNPEHTSSAYTTRKNMFPMRMECRSQLAILHNNAKCCTRNVYRPSNEPYQVLTN